MPRLKVRPPKLSKDKNYAVVYCNGERLPMGRWGTPEAEKNYRRFLSEWAVCTQSAVTRNGSKVELAELVVAYLDWAEINLHPAHFNHSKVVASFLIDLHGHTPVEKFGPKALTAVQKRMAESGRFSRNYVNDLIGRARTIFNWGVAQELVPESVAAALKYVVPLKKGKTVAYETVPREEVPDEVVDRTLPHLFPTVAAMVQVQRWASMRPNEVCRMKVGDIDRSRKDGIWIFQPLEHKGAWRGLGRPVALGKPEQDLIAPRLEGKSPEAAVFSPRDTMAEKKERDAARRKTKAPPSQVQRDKDRAKKPKSRVREFYDSSSYRQSITYGIDAANKTLPDGEKIPKWTPYQLRHAAVTEITLENDGNLDVARAVAGQKSIAVTQTYNHADLKIAIEQAKKRGRKVEE